MGSNIWAIGLASVVAGCAGGGTPTSTPSSATTTESYADQAAKIPPKISVAAAKTRILKDKSRLFKDADSVRDARISEPFTCFTMDGDCICAEVNARNSFGGYTGVQLVGFKFSDKSIESIGEMASSARDGACGRLSPFPELNGRAR